MAQGPDRRTRRLALSGDVDRDGEEGRALSPSALRAAIAETREELARHLRALKHHLFHPRLSPPDSATETDMSTAKKKAKGHASATGGSSSKAHLPAKSPSSSAKGRASADVEQEGRILAQGQGEGHLLQPDPIRLRQGEQGRQGRRADIEGEDDGDEPQAERVR